MISDAKKKLLDIYNRAYELYRLRQFSEALVLFEEAANIDPDDGPIALYIERCKGYIEVPPPADWDGVYVMTTK